MNSVSAQKRMDPLLLSRRSDRHLLRTSPLLISIEAWPKQLLVWLLFKFRIYNLVIILLNTVFCLNCLAAPAPKFNKQKIKIGEKTIVVEIADTEPKHAYGLMHRSSLLENQGMLFIFKDEQTRSFWMKNTFIPLSIAYFDGQKKIIDMQDMKPAASEMQTDFPSYISKQPAQYALEMNLGWFVKNKIKLGQKFELIK